MKLFEKGELKLLWPFYLSIITQGLFFIWTIFYVVYFNQLGLTFLQISSFLSIYYLFGIIFEIPTGVIADIFGRKFSVVLGSILFGFIFILIGLFQSYYILLLLFALLSISGTLISGADETLIVDHLKNNKRVDLVHNYYIKESSILGLSIILNGFIGALLVKYFGLNIIWISTGLSMLLGTLFIWIFINENFKRNKIKISSIKKSWNYSKFSIKYSLTHPILLYLLLAWFFTVISFSLSSDVSWQPFLLSLNFKVYWLGYLISFCGLLKIISSFLSKPLLKIIKKEKNYLVLVHFILFLTILPIILISNWKIALLIFCTSSFLIDLMVPIKNKFFQDYTISKYRATITSFKSVVTSIAASIGMLTAGYMIDVIGPKLTIFYSSFLLIPSIIFYYLIKNKKHNYKKR
ncbi:MAG: MFS transporter [Candidatus Nanoarchaeia archaeon]|nr:MFS transporter [Candidatus Nanoarchaeia archaeon]MDD5587993.1 MFS transporter [Candidatus Nanoarchaeia archaeon]